MEAPPKFVQVVVEQRGANVLLKAFVAKKKITPGEICGGVGYSQYGVVRLPRPVDEVRLLDSSTTPPALRWPK